MQNIEADLSCLELDPEYNVGVLEAIIEFGSEPMGPVKLLQLFAGIGVLPNRFDLRTGDWPGSVVELEVENNPKSRRVLAKAENMPTCRRLSVLPRVLPQLTSTSSLSLVNA